MSLGTFADLGLDSRLVEATKKAGYHTPTPIQAAAIPIVAKGGDLLGLAQTGTGKTAAFALPILQRLLGNDRPTGGQRSISVLVLTPTRELATQIGDNFRLYGGGLPFRSAVIFGGVGIEPQKALLRAGLDILIATPGRLLDLANQRQLDLRNLSIFVLDEADRMLDMGFIHDVRKVISLLPRQRQTLFFSATMPPEAKHLADSILVRPQTVAVTPVSSTVERIDQSLYFVEKNDKRALLATLLQDESMRRVLVFSRTKHGANRIAEYLEKARISAAAIHGNKSQSARERALSGFKSGDLRVLVATDIAARGIDIDDVTHVFNFDLPEVPETYVHRIGRTARAGRDGIAIAFCDSEERDYLRGIERLNRKAIPVVQWSRSELVISQPDAPPQQQRFSDRPSNLRARGLGVASHQRQGDSRPPQRANEERRPSGAAPQNSQDARGDAAAPGGEQRRRRRRFRGPRDQQAPQAGSQRKA